MEVSLKSIARNLLWLHLAHGRANICIELTNANRSIDGLMLQFALIGKDEREASVWKIVLADPDAGVWNSLSSHLFYPELLCWPTEPVWGEFEYGQVWPNPLDPEDDYEFEELIAGDNPGEWPSLLEGAGYRHWALVGMARRGSIAPDEFVRFLRDQDGLSTIGDVEVRASEEPDDQDWPFPFETQAVITLLTLLRKQVSESDEGSRLQDEANLSKFLIEPLMMITPGIPDALLEFIASDPTCPASIMARKFAEITGGVAVDLNTSSALEAIDVWELEDGVHHLQSRMDAQKPKKPKKDLFVASTPEAQEITENVSDLINRILSSVPDPDEDADEESLEGLVGRHLQFLQASMWLNGTIAMPESVVKKWTTKLKSLAKALENDDEEMVSELAYKSWAAF